MVVLQDGSKSETLLGVEVTNSSHLQLLDPDQAILPAETGVVWVLQNRPEVMRNR